MSEAGNMAPGSTCGVCRREEHKFTPSDHWTVDDGCPCCAANHVLRCKWASGGQRCVLPDETHKPGEHVHKLVSP